MWDHCAAFFFASSADGASGKFVLLPAVKGDSVLSLSMQSNSSEGNVVEQGDELQQCLPRRILRQGNIVEHGHEVQHQHWSSAEAWVLLRGLHG